MSRRAWAQFCGISVIWGLPYFFIRLAVRDLDPGTLVFFRTGLASLILLPFAIRRRQLRELIKHWPAVLAYTLTEITVPWFLLATAEQKVTSSLAGLLVATVPIFGLLIAWALGHERPGADGSWDCSSVSRGSSSSPAWASRDRISCRWVRSSCARSATRSRR